MRTNVCSWQFGFQCGTWTFKLMFRICAGVYVCVAASVCDCLLVHFDLSPQNGFQLMCVCVRLSLNGIYHILTVWQKRQRQQSQHTHWACVWGRTTGRCYSRVQLDSAVICLACQACIRNVIQYASASLSHIERPQVSLALMPAINNAGATSVLSLYLFKCSRCSLLLPPPLLHLAYLTAAWAIKSLLICQARSEAGQGPGPLGKCKCSSNCYQQQPPRGGQRDPNFCGNLTTLRRLLN